MATNKASPALSGIPSRARVRVPYPNPINVLDTETTGFSHAHGHRIVEIGVVKLGDKGQIIDEFQCYINPERKCDVGAYKVHKLSDAFLSRQRKFDTELAEELLAFLEDDPIIAHNAKFDIGFLNAELAKLGMAPLSHEVHCTQMASKKVNLGLKSHSLDSLCKHYGADARDAAHGALIDARLLAHIAPRLLPRIANIDVERDWFKELVLDERDMPCPEIMAIIDAYPELGMHIAGHAALAKVPSNAYMRSLAVVIYKWIRAQSKDHPLHMELDSLLEKAREADDNIVSPLKTMIISDI